ncbi:hypothetical protein IT415_01585 [bacterium]|nr:hypothetical protein [bacterium]
MPSTKTPAKKQPRFKLHIDLETEAGLKREEVRELKRLTCEALDLRNADCARILYDMCLELGLFEPGVLNFTPADLAEIIHGDEDLELRANGMLATDPRVDPLKRYRALKAVEQTLHDRERMLSVDEHMLMMYRLASTTLGDVDRARAWFVDGSHLHLLDLLVKLYFDNDGLTALERRDIEQRLFSLFDGITNYDDFFFELGMLYRDDLVQALSYRYGADRAQTLLDLDSEEPSEAELRDREGAIRYSHACATHFGWDEVDPYP